jgi:UPF0716 family protein affecting phage T7 exclusion
MGYARTFVIWLGVVWAVELALAGLAIGVSLLRREASTARNGVRGVPAAALEEGPVSAEGDAG